MKNPFPQIRILEKKSNYDMNYELLLRSLFSTFHGQKKYCSVRTKMLHDLIFLGGGVKIFLGLAVLVLLVWFGKGCLSKTPFSTLLG